MASLSNLTDKELRDELKKYEIDAVVTKSSRTILLKKLNHLISAGPEKSSNASVTKAKRRSGSRNIKVSKTVQKETTPYKAIIPYISPNQNKSKDRSSIGTSFLNSYSSDEDATEPEEEQEVYEPIARPRRSSRNNLTPLNCFKSSFLSTETESNSTLGKKSIPLIRKKSKSSYLSSPVTTFSSQESQSNLSRSITNNQDLYDTGSDSDLNLLDETDYENRSPATGSFLLKDRLSGRNDIFNRDYSQNKPLQRNNLSFSSRISNSFRSNLNNGNSGGAREEVEITSPDDVLSQELMTSSNSHVANGQNQFSHVRKSHKEKSSWDTKICFPSIPILLLILLGMFFFILGFCYISINGPLISSIVSPSLYFDQWSSNMISFSKDIVRNEKIIHKEEVEPVHQEISSKFPVCPEEEPIKISCLSIDEAEGVPDLLLLLEKTILPSLLHQAKLYQCRESPKLYLDTDAIATIIKDTHFSKTKSDIIFGLHGLGKLTKLHPNLGIESFWDNVETPSLLGLAVKNPPKEITCHLIAAFYSFINIIIFIVLGVSLACIALQIFRYRKKQNEEFEQKLFETVEQILEILENSCGTGTQDFIAVNHVRDCFIPPREREAKADIWKKAVAYIDTHDSRVYRDVQSVGGEDCQVWRWVSGAPKTPPEKIWQGQAFESLENTQNVPQVSPTSCLKIRSMFDRDIEFGDNWPCRIQDSLLEKCEGIDIVHIAVDRMSKEGCVYIKCASTNEAGKAFRSLHGWWFDGNLVTVKYLRDERYQERFPNADNAMSPLKPSNNKRLSLQTEPESIDQPRTSTRKKSTQRTSLRNS